MLDRQTHRVTLEVHDESGGHPLRADEKGGVVAKYKTTRNNLSMRHFSAFCTIFLARRNNSKDEAFVAVFGGWEETIMKQRGTMLPLALAHTPVSLYPYWSQDSIMHRMPLPVAASRIRCFAEINNGLH